MLGRGEPRTGTALDRWIEAARNALTQATPVQLPHVAHGAAVAPETAAIGYLFEAVAGQVLEVDFAQWPQDSAAESWAAAVARSAVYVDVLFVDSVATVAHYRPLEGLVIEGSSLRVPISASGYHVLRLQAEPFAPLVYGITLELRAALPFPVRGRNMAAVQSFFGDPRDRGARKHEGIDIFAARGTPVVAVSDGRAVPGRNDLGGNIVWLNTAGVSYYYAHLDRTAVVKPRRVRAGDVLGFVGNTGNAASTPPHLHFAIYRWGSGAIDPLPQFVERRFESERPTIADPIELAVPVLADAAPAREPQTVAVAMTATALPVGAGANGAGASDAGASELALDVGAMLGSESRAPESGSGEATSASALLGTSAASSPPAIDARPEPARTRITSALVSRETLRRFKQSVGPRRRASKSLALGRGSIDLEGTLR